MPSPQYCFTLATSNIQKFCIDYKYFGQFLQLTLFLLIQKSEMRIDKDFSSFGDRFWSNKSFI
jgi:hypothetical protein